MRDRESLGITFQRVSLAKKNKPKTVEHTDKMHALLLQRLLHLKNINALLVNSEEALVAVCDVVDIRGLALVLNHSDLGEFYMKGSVS